MWSPTCASTALRTTAIVRREPRGRNGYQTGERTEVLTPEDVVEEVNIRIAVHRSRQGDSGLLPPAEIDAALADFGLVGVLQLHQVVAQAAHVENVLVRVFSKRLSEEDVVLLFG